jgi:hypothetical protein
MRSSGSVITATAMVFTRRTDRRKNSGTRFLTLDCRLEVRLKVRLETDLQWEPFRCRFFVVLEPTFS